MDQRIWEKIKIGEDPWMGADVSYRLSKNFIHRLHLNGIFTLSDAAIPSVQENGRQKWLSMEYFKREGPLA